MRRRTKKVNLALVEDPLLATAAASAGCVNPLTPPDEQPNQFERMESMKFPDTPMEYEVEEDPFDTAFAEQEPDNEKPYLITHAKVYAIAEK